MKESTFRTITSLYLFLVVFFELFCRVPQLLLVSNAVSAGMILPFLVYWIGYKRNISIDTNNTLYTFWGVYFIVSFLWHPDMNALEWNDFQPYILIPPMMIIFWNLLKWTDALDYVMWAFFAIVIINSLFLIVFKDSFFVFLINKAGRFVGIFSNANMLAITTNIAMFFSLIWMRRKTQNSFYIANFIMFAGTILVISSGSKKGVILALLAWAMYVIFNTAELKRRKGQLVLLIILFSLFTPYYLSNVNINERWEMTSQRFETMNENMNLGEQYVDFDTSTGQRIYFIEIGLEMFKEKPLFGYGLNAFQYFHWHYSHSTPIELLVNGGVIAFLLYYFRYLIAFRQLFLTRMREKYIYIAILLSLLLIENAAILFLEKSNLIVVMIALYASMKKGERVNNE